MDLVSQRSELPHRPTRPLDVAPHEGARSARARAPAPQRTAPGPGAGTTGDGTAVPIELGRKRPASGGVAGWLLPPLLLSATLVAVFLVLRGPDELFLWALGAMFALASTWVLVSVFFPASVDRTCPACGAAGLERLDPETTRGVGCTRCGFRDPTASSFLMAEAEGPLEPTVLRERRARCTVRADDAGDACEAPGVEGRTR